MLLFAKKLCYNDFSLTFGESMTAVLLPAIWLIVLIVGLPLLSETVYTPSLPDIARTLRVSESLVEFTLTIYLFGFAVGTLIWGKISDKAGRKPCVLAGLLIFLLGCLGCYLSTSITLLMVSRFIQAFGGSVGSVLGQAICRDAFHGPALGKVYSSTGSSLAVFPAIGPVIGGFIAQSFGWYNIFLFLIAFAIVLTILVLIRLPETHLASARKAISSIEVALSLLRNKKVLGFGLIVAICNGISFSYFAEGSFFLIKLLGLSSTQFGLSFIAIAASTMLGGTVSKKLHDTHTSQEIMRYGLMVILLATCLFSSLILLNTYLHMPNNWLIGITLISQMIIMFGICMCTSNALALALVEYKWCIGTASSLFGFFYYCFISFITLGMGSLHNGTLLPMPLYFLALSILMLLIEKKLIRGEFKPISSKA